MTMDNTLLAGLGAIIVIAVCVYWVRRRATANDQPFTGNVESTGHGVDAVVQPTATAASATVRAHVDLDGEVRALAAEGRIIEAVKLVRDRTGIGLAAAKDKVDSLHGKALTPASSIASLTFGNAHIDVNDEARRLLHAGKLIEAIKLVRERTGMGLKEAKDYVERL